jgi:RHS repeat-associated protein
MDFARASRSFVRFCTSEVRFLVAIGALLASGAAAAQNNASFVYQTVPLSMIAGQTYQATVVMQNTGTSTWTSASGYKLGSQNPADNLNFGLSRVDLASSVAPGQQYSFTGNLTAPATAGTYNFQWQMGQEGVQWFGALTPNIVVTVTAPASPVYTVPPTSSGAGVPGATPGALEVTTTGNAKYTLPIVVPPGTNKMQPQLALQYASGAPNGPMGVGWTLAGLGQISRCPWDQVHDGSAAAVSLSNNDRLCVDGQRLILVNGTYGAIAAEYRTEVHNFTKFAASATSKGNGPTSFTAVARDGTTYEYGTTPDAQRVLPGEGTGTPVSWALSRVTDARGNYYSISYTSNSGQQVPSRIDYTGNANSPALSPYNSVVFVYDTARSDVESAYVAGYKILNPQRLARIETYSGSTLVKTYSITYQTSTPTVRSRVASITECAGASGPCLSPTSFTWEDTALTSHGTSISYPAPDTEFGPSFSQDTLFDPGKSYWIDLNGDGRPEHCRASKHTVSDTSYDYEVLFCGFTQPSGPPVVASFGHSDANTNYQFIDVNADGITDVCDERGNCYLMGSSGPTGSILRDPFALTLPRAYTRWADANGDGLTDFCSLGADGNLTCAPGTGPGTFGSATSLGTFAVPACFAGNTCADLQFSWANLSGDVPWFCRIESGAMRCQKLTSSGLGAEVATPAGTDLGQDRGQQWADVNGDGLDDFCRVLNDGSNRVACTLSTGTGFGDTIVSQAITLGSAPRWADVNGDGKADFCRVNATSINPECLLSTGAGFGANISYAIDATAIYDPRTGRTAFDVADANSDGRVDLCSMAGCVTAAGTSPDYLLSLTDGLNATAAIDYDNLSNNAVYTKGTGAAFPLVDVQDNSFVVRTKHLPNGIGGFLDTTYKYESLKVHEQGRGSFGFGATVTTDANGTSTRTEQRQDYPFVSLPRHVVVSNGAATLADTTQTYFASAGPSYSITPADTVAKTYDLNGAFLNWVETRASGYDAYGNPQQIDVAYKQTDGSADGFSSTISLTYQNDQTNWILGLPISRTVTRRMTGKPDSTRTTSQSYFAANPGRGLVQQTVVEPNNGGLSVTNLKLTTAYTYDQFGNLATRMVSGANIATRTDATIGYDSQGRFATSIKNALNQQEIRTYDPTFGNVLTSTDANSLKTTWTYDAFGRIATLSRPDGTRQTYDRQPCVNCVGSSAYVTYRTDTVAASGATAAPYLRVYSDALDRPVLTETPGFNGGDVAVVSTYDSLGRLQSRSKPFYNDGSAMRQIQYSYDAIGREFQVTTPDGDTGGAVSTSTTTYNGRTQTVQNNIGVSFSKTVDSQGNVISVVDAQGAAEQSTVAYEYDQWNNLSKTTDAAGNVTSISYDLLGRKTEIDDKDSGTRTFSLDNLGQVLTSADAKNQVTTFTYDVLGRRKSRTEADLTSNWYYEADANGAVCAKGAGKLCQVTASNGYSRKYSYDSYGRKSGLTTHIDVDYTGTWSYDAAGRLATKTYPASISTTPLTLAYSYTSQGLFASVADGYTGSLYWAKGADNSDGNVVQETYGNGLIGTRTYAFNTGRISAIGAGASGSPTSVQNLTFGYDSLGRLTSRGDAYLGTSETFAYDALNRLYSTVLNAPGVPGGSQASTFTYDAIGNLTSKSGVGTYSYTPGKPHAVSGVNGTVNGVSMPSYTYDANGNMSADGTRSFTWTSFNMPSVISKTATTGSPGSGSAAFSYGAEHQRVKQVWTQGSSQVTTIYLDDFDMEKVIDGVGATYKHFVKVGGRIVASVVRAPGGNSVVYLLPDHLGSTSVVVDNSGSITRMAYDPWGDRRFTSGSIGASDPTNTIQPTSTNRGYTGHEMLDQGNLGLIHMNGRVFDPTLGRFLSADTLVQDPYSTQSYNRFSYVGNAPLDRRDPSGHMMEPIPIEPYRVETSGSLCSTACNSYSFGSLVTISGYDLLSSSYRVAPGMIRPIGILPGMLPIIMPSPADARAFAAAVTAALKKAAAYVGNLVQSAQNAISGGDTTPDSSMEAGAGNTSEPASGAARPEGVPDNWIEVPSRDGKGTKWVDPSNPKGGDYVRERGDGSLTQVKDGRALDANGNPAPKLSSPEAHFPRDQWTFRP